MIHKAEIVFVRLLIPFSAGILSCPLAKASLAKYIISAALLSFSYLFILNIGYRYFKAHRFKETTGILFYLLIFILGILSGLLNKQSYAADYYGNQKSQYLKVIIDEEPQQKGGIMRFTAKVVRAYRLDHGLNVSGRILIAFKVDALNHPAFQYGDELMIPAGFTFVDPPYNPSEFDVQAWLATQNIYNQIFLAPHQIRKVSGRKGNPVIRYALELRQKQLSVYRKLIKDEEAFAVASTLILGYRADLSAEILNAYSKTGTIHALSVSGMHVGMIYIVLEWLLFFMNRKKALRIFKVILVLLLIWFYSLLTGLCPSILRSVLMLSVFILAKFFQRTTNSYNVMAFAAFCLLVFNPFIIWDVGFQLSFLSVFGLIYLQPKIYHACHFENKWADKLWNIIATSLAAQIVTFPLSIYYFHQFPVYFLLGNLFILLPVTIMMYMGLIILIFHAHFLGSVFEWIINFTDVGLAWIAKLPLSALSSIWISKIELWLLCCAILLFLTAFSKRNKKLFFGSVCVFLIFQSLLSTDKLQALGQQKIIFFSLKKNYAAAFIYADTAVLLTDLDAAEKTFQFFVKPALDQHKVKELHFIRWPETFKSSGLNISAHQITFHQCHILKFDTSFNHKIIRGYPEFDVLWLHDNPEFEPLKLKKQFHFKTLVADAGSKSDQLKRYLDSAIRSPAEHHILKRNKGYTLEAKPPGRIFR